MTQPGYQLVEILAQFLPTTPSNISQSEQPIRRFTYLHSKNKLRQIMANNVQLVSRVLALSHSRPTCIDPTSYTGCYQAQRS